MTGIVDFLAKRARLSDGVMSSEVVELISAALALERTPLEIGTQELLWKSGVVHRVAGELLREACSAYRRRLAGDMWNRLEAAPESTVAAGRLYASALEPADVERLLDLLERHGTCLPKPGADGAAVVSVLCSIERHEVFDELTRRAPVGSVLVPCGWFRMGGGANSDENPELSLWLPSFFVARFPVTVAEMGFVRGGTLFERCTASGAAEDWPAHYLSLAEAQAVCEHANARLPSEQEWEKAARGPRGTRYPWGDEFSENCANTLESGIGTFTPVQRYRGVGDSAYGVVDMVGNAWEWTSSTYRLYSQRQSIDADPRPLDRTTDRVLRGGAYDFDKNGSNCLNRYRSNPSRGWDTHGVRMTWGW